MANKSIGGIAGIFLEESQIQIDVLVAGAIERPRRGLAGAAAGGRGIVIGRESGGAKTFALLTQQGLPDILGRADDAAGKFVIGIVGARTALLPQPVQARFPSSVTFEDLRSRPTTERPELSSAHNSPAGMNQNVFR